MSEGSSSPVISASDMRTAVFIGVVFTAIRAALSPDATALLVDREISTLVGGVVFVVEWTVLYLVLSVLCDPLRS